MQISKFTSVCSGVPLAGLQREIRSGRGRPTAFFITSVMKLVKIREMKKPRRVTWVLWRGECVIREQARRIRRGMPPA